MSNHQLAMAITKLLIESELSIFQQMKVIKKVQDTLTFCKKTGQEMKQQKLKL